LIHAWRRQALTGPIEGFHAVRIVAEPQAAPPAIETSPGQDIASAVPLAEPKAPDCPPESG